MIGTESIFLNPNSKIPSSVLLWKGGVQRVEESDCGSGKQARHQSVVGFGLYRLDVALIDFDQRGYAGGGFQSIQMPGLDYLRG